MKEIVLRAGRVEKKDRVEEGSISAGRIRPVGTEHEYRTGRRKIWPGRGLSTKTTTRFRESPLLE